MVVMMVDLEVEDLELVVEHIIRLIWECLNRKTYFLWGCLRSALTREGQRWWWF